MLKKNKIYFVFFTNKDVNVYNVQKINSTFVSKNKKDIQ